MEALVIHAPKDLRVETVTTEPVAAGQIRVRVRKGGICGSDLHYFNHGGFGTIRIKEPMVLGHEVAGTVTAVAPDVTAFKPGDRVAVNPSRPCWNCKYCHEGLPNQCLDMRFYGSAMRMPHVQGAFRTGLVCNEEQCFRIADGVPITLAALAEPFSVCLHGVTRAGPLINKRVLVTGCGPIGVLSVAAALLHGAAEVTATDIVDEPLAVAAKLGAHRTINVARDTDWARRYSADKGTFDVLLECSGNQRALRDGLEVLRPRGTIVQLGIGGDVSIPQNVIVAKELALLGSFRFHAEFELAVRIINERRIDLSPVVTQTMPISRAVEAFELASDRKRAMKVLIDFAEEAA